MLKAAAVVLAGLTPTAAPTTEAVAPDLALASQATQTLASMAAIMLFGWECQTAHGGMSPTSPDLEDLPGYRGPPKAELVITALTEHLVAVAVTVELWVAVKVDVTVGVDVPV